MITTEEIEDYMAQSRMLSLIWDLDSEDLEELKTCPTCFAQVKSAWKKQHEVGHELSKPSVFGGGTLLDMLKR